MSIGRGAGLAKPIDCDSGQVRHKRVSANWRSDVMRTGSGNGEVDGVAIREVGGGAAKRFVTPAPKLLLSTVLTVMILA